MRYLNEEIEKFLGNDLKTIFEYNKVVNEIGCKNIDFKVDNKTPFPSQRLKWKLEAHEFLKDIFQMMEEEKTPFGINEAYFYLKWYLEERYKVNKNIAEFISNGNCADLFFLQTWAMYKQIYKFDKDCLQMLKDTEYTTIPVNAFYKLPYNAFWIDNKFTDASGNEYEGCHVSLSIRKKLFASDTEEENHIGFQFVKNNKDMDMLYAYIPLKEGEKRLEDYFEKNTPKECISLLKQAIPLVLYLCADNKDIEEIKYVTKNEIAKNRETIRSGCKTTKVGYKIGSSFKKHNTRYVYSTKSEGQGSSKSPHFRKGHYHHYWIGKKDGSEERKLVLMFVEPTFVNGEDKKNDLATVHKVKR